MNIVTLEEIKANARIDSQEDDILLEQIGEAAEQTVLNLLERDLDDIRAEFHCVPAPIKQAVLMMATHLYEYRGVVNPTALYNVPYSIDAMLKPYIRL